MQRRQGQHGVKMRSITGRVGMAEVMLALLDHGDVGCAALLASDVLHNRCRDGLMDVCHPLEDAT